MIDEMELALLALWGDVKSGLLSAAQLLEEAEQAVAIPAPQITAAATELVVTVATSVNATADVTYPSIAAGMSLSSGSASQTRLGAAYQRRTNGQTSAGRFTFDNGTPTNNGLAELTVRFGAA